MRYQFRLSDFPNSTFELKTTFSSAKIYMDDVELKKSNETGKPFLIPVGNDSFVKAFPKTTFPNPNFDLEINGTRHQLFDKPKWYEYVLAVIPLLLLFIGGVIGGAIGGLGSAICFYIFRQKDKTFTTYLIAAGVVVASYLLYFLVTSIFYKMIN